MELLLLQRAAAERFYDSSNTLSTPSILSIKSDPDIHLDGFGHNFKRASIPRSSSLPPMGRKKEEMSFLCFTLKTGIQHREPAFHRFRTHSVCCKGCLITRIHGRTAVSDGTTVGSFQGGG